MNRYGRKVVFVLGLALCGAAAPAGAATFCVNNTLSLAIALSIAQGNGEDDTINLETGTYNLDSELQYAAAPAETYRLAIIGGQIAGCGAYAGSGSTTLDGQNLVRPLSITAHGEVDIGRITLTHGNPTQYAGGGLNLVNTSDAPTYVFASAFVANHTASSGGAFYIASAGDVYLWSNLIIGNTGSPASAAYLYDLGNTYITGNTVIGNQFVNHSGLGGLDLTGSGHFWVSNNILWNNEVVDVYDQAGLTDYAYNDVGVISGFAPHSQSHEMDVDPDFGGFLSVRPAPESPLINAGEDSPPGGVGGCCDPSGYKRLVGTHVDIGAYESDVLLRSTFQ